jgi:hypothetical protein
LFLSKNESDGLVALAYNIDQINGILK